MHFPESGSYHNLLDCWQRTPDIKWAVSTWHTGSKFRVGSHLQVWMEGDPRQPDGILRLAEYVCVKNGDESTSMFRKQEKFTLQNHKPKPSGPPLFEALPKAKQRPLLRGLDDEPGQLDLFDDMTAS